MIEVMVKVLTMIKGGSGPGTGPRALDHGHGHGHDRDDDDGDDEDAIGVEKVEQVGKDVSKVENVENAFIILKTSETNV